MFFFVGSTLRKAFMAWKQNACEQLTQRLKTAKVMMR